VVQRIGCEAKYHGAVDPETETFAKADIPSGGGVVRNMTATKDGRAYIACSGVDKVGVVQPRFTTEVGADCMFGDAGYQESKVRLANQSLDS
jgi:hypothetical protein